MKKIRRKSMEIEETNKEKGEREKNPEETRERSHQNMNVHRDTIKIVLRVILAS